MASLCRKGFALVIVWYMTVHICSAAVTGTTCDPANNDGTLGVCTAVDENAECKTGADKCSCKTGYKEGSPDSDTCVRLSVSETTCNPSDNNAQTGGAAICSAVNENAECKTGETECSCKAGYKEGSPDSHTCVLKSVSETVCDPTNNDAQAGGAAVCKAVNANAECKTGATKCSCKSGYKEGSPDSHTCVLKSVSETVCDPNNKDAQTGGAAVCKAVNENAECKTGTTKCSCKSEYKEGSPDSHTCVLKSVSETICDPANNVAQTGASAVCSAVDGNAECKTGEAKCSCKAGYKEGSPESHTCVLKSVSETACDPSDDDATTGGAAVCKDVDANAECPDSTTTCACKAGYKQDATSVNSCVTDPGSSATLPWMTTSVIGTGLLTALLRLIS